MMITFVLGCFVMTWFCGYVALDLLFERIQNIETKVDEIHAKLKKGE